MIVLLQGHDLVVYGMSTKNPTMMLKFSKGNAKLPKSTLIFSLPAGHTCPGAKDCQTSVVAVGDTRKIIDGEHQQFRCYAANAEVRLKDTFKLRQHNYGILRPHSMNRDVIVGILLDSMKATGMKGITKVRVHESGDYFTYSYFAAWMEVATAFPHLTFYSYTKSLPFLVRGKKEGIIPPNFIFTASKGGHFDRLIATNGFKSVTVTTTEAETQAAMTLGGKFDHDDTLPLGDADFYLQIHGVQRAGTMAAKYWDKLVKQKKGGYSRKNGIGNGGKALAPLQKAA